MENINTTGTFQEYMESVKTEVQRQLGCDYVVELVNMGKHLWSTDSDEEFLTYQIRIFDNEGWTVHFSVCEMEFDRNKHQPKNLIELARVRFVDAEWGLKDAKEQANV